MDWSLQKNIRKAQIKVKCYDRQHHIVQSAEQKTIYVAKSAPLGKVFLKHGG